jgi:Icc-related predicted phosphoesterase
LVTHGPAYGYVDSVVGEYTNLGCEKLIERIEQINPAIHICGHIHTGYGYQTNDKTHFINASVLNEQYVFSQKPITFDYNSDTDEIVFI